MNKLKTILILMVLISSLVYAEETTKETTNIDTTLVTCTDSDGGKEFYEKGKTSDKVSEKTDYCENDVLVEYYCDGEIKVTDYKCPNGCKDGACLEKPEICTTEYDPVCGEIAIVCVKAPCDPIRKTYSNKCNLEAAGATFLYEGECKEEVVKEQVKCVFSGSDKEQKCYSDKGSCSGKETCVIDVKGEKGEKITWKSSCGGYAYTTIDGESEYAEFSCKEEKECKAVFSHCSCSYVCQEVTEGEPRDDCARVCGEEETTSYKPDCGYRDGVCQDFNVKQECKSYENEDGCKVTICSDGRETITCPTIPSGKYVKLNERFGLVEGQSAKVTDYGYMKITLNSISPAICIDRVDGGECKKSSAAILVEMPSECAVSEDSPTQECELTAGINIILNEGESEEIFGAKISYLDQQTNGGIFIAQKPTIVVGGVDIEISPEEQTIGYGDRAVYKIKVTDKHPRVAVLCEQGSICEEPVYTYFIDVRNLPFLKEYPKQIQLEAGQSETLELIVRPYVVETVEEAEVTTTKTAARTASGGITGQAVAKPVKVEAKEQAVSAEKAEIRAQVKPTVIELYRTYKFNVRAMQKGDPKNQDVAYAVLSIKPTEPPRPRPPEFPGEEVEIKLHKGWNLISLPGKLVKFEKIRLDKKLVGFVYLKEEQRYVTLNEAEKILGKRFREYLARNAFWVYAYNEIELKVKIDREVSYSDIDLKKGWNLVPITEDMLGGYLSDIKGDCEFEKLYLWNAAEQKWEKIDESHQFSDNLLNYGFLIKAKEDCRLGGAIVALTPPAMPE